MLRIADITEELIQTDQVAFESLKMGLLNLSAYAERIHAQVENLTKKPVRKGTIVVALSRIANKIEKLPSLTPEIKITDISTKSSLCAITYEKTADIQRRIAVLHPFQLSPTDLFSIIEGTTKVTLICSTKSTEKILKHFGTQTENISDNLAAVTIQILMDPRIHGDDKKRNSHFGPIAILASKRVKTIEIVTTFNEISFIIDQTDTEKALAALSPYL